MESRVSLGEGRWDKIYGLGRKNTAALEDPRDMWRVLLRKLYRDPKFLLSFLVLGPRELPNASSSFGCPFWLRS